MLWACVAAATGSLTLQCGLSQSTKVSESPRASKELPLETAADETTDESIDSPEVERGAIDLSNSVLQYNFDSPAEVISLPESLREISDIVALSESELACVQDERGIVFVYDLKAKRISEEVHFGSHGDYEGLAIAAPEAYVLRSDGVLFQLSSLNRHPSVRKIELHLPFSESESLCLDEHHHRLLIAPKSRDQIDKAKDSRPIYAFDLQSQTLIGEPVTNIRLRDIRRYAKHHDLPLPRRPKKNGESMRNALHFLPAAMAVNPSSGELFVVSAVDRVVISCTASGKITGYAVLDASTFRQPEGIAFLPSGDMLLANEGAGKVATLVVVRRKREPAPAHSTN